MIFSFLSFIHSKISCRWSNLRVTFVTFPELLIYPVLLPGVQCLLLSLGGQFSLWSCGTSSMCGFCSLPGNRFSSETLSTCLDGMDSPLLLSVALVSHEWRPREIGCSGGELPCPGPRCFYNFWRVRDQTSVNPYLYPFTSCKTRVARIPRM